MTARFGRIFVAGWCVLFGCGTTTPNVVTSAADVADVDSIVDSAAGTDASATDGVASGDAPDRSDPTATPMRKLATWTAPTEP
jgi:hypothetical protein